MSGYNFSDRTRRALQAGGDAAAMLGHEYIGTEHLLLGLLHDRDSVAVAVLLNLGANIDGIRAMIEDTAKKGDSGLPAGAQRPYTSRAKKVLELAMICARDDAVFSVGTQHVLLGLLREEEGVAAQVLVHSGVTLPRVTASLGGVARTNEGTPGDRD